MRGFYLSFRAARSLEKIADYSRETHGAQQGRAYVWAVLDRCRALAAGSLPHQSCRNHFAENLRENLRFARSGRHYIIFVETETSLRIVDILHQSADIGGRLEETES